MENAMEKLQQKIICPLCQESSTRFFCDKNNYDLYKCDNCKLLFVYPLPKTIDVYDKSYFAGADKGFGYVDYDSDKEPMVPTFNKYLDLLAKFGIKNGKFLDIGAATGFFMSLAKERGFEVSGVEISPFASEEGRKKGLNIITGELENAQFPDEFFDVISLCDVLEHVPNPVTFFREVSRILKKGGLILINTPDAGSLWAKIMGKRWHLLVPPEHLHYFSSQNIKKYLAKDQFEVKSNIKIGKRFTFKYIFSTLYKRQGLSLWNFLTKVFSNKGLSNLYIPINLHDNLLMILEKK